MTKNPESNPDELSRADLKTAITAKIPERRKEELKKAVVRQFRRIAKPSDRVKKCFAHAPPDMQHDSWRVEQAHDFEKRK